MAESEEELKRLKSILIKLKQESEKASLKLNIQKIKIMASGPITSWQIDGEAVETVDSKITADSDCSRKIKSHLLLGRKTMTNIDSVLKIKRHYCASKDLYRQSYGFSSSHVWMWELDRKEGWVPKNWCLRIVVLEKTFESPLDSK